VRPGISKTLLKKAASFENKYFKDYGLNGGLRHLFSTISRCKIVVVLPDEFQREGVVGRYKDAEILLSSRLVGEELDQVLLHEMIHYYEITANDPQNGTRYLIEYLSFYLRDKLAAKLPIQEIIEYELYSMAQAHTYFHVLMSIDLDLKLNKPPGTIFDYGRAKAWKRFCGI
jgi:hypothetical protein